MFSYNTPNFNGKQLHIMLGPTTPWSDNKNPLSKDGATLLGVLYEVVLRS
jgi:hypothetical protein